MKGLNFCLNHRNISACIFTIVLLGFSVSIGIAQIPDNYANRACVNNLLEEDFSATLPIGWEGDFMVFPAPLNEGWILQSGSSPDAPGTGADGAYSGDYYLYMETNGPAPTLSTYTINTPEIYLTDVNATIRLGILMNGGDIGHLKVNVLSGPGYTNSETVLFLEGAQHTSSDISNWEEAFIDIREYSGQSVKIAFEGMKLTSNQGDIAIDLVQVCSEVRIPTMGEWGVICLGLLFLIFGVVSIGSVTAPSRLT